MWDIFLLIKYQWNVFCYHTFANICIPESVPLYAGFVNQNVTLPCQPGGIGGSTRIKWLFNCSDCKGPWYMIVKLQLENTQFHHEFFGDFKDRNISVSSKTGNLSIEKFQLADEGLYMCQSAGNEDYTVELKSAGAFTVDLLHNKQLTCYSVTTVQIFMFGHNCIWSIVTGLIILAFLELYYL